MHADLQEAGARFLPDDSHCHPGVAVLQQLFNALQHAVWQRDQRSWLDPAILSATSRKTVNDIDLPILEGLVPS
jgi:hypothetical protein